MADTTKQRKKGKKKDAQENSGPPPKDNPTKEEYAVARWMRKNIPVKKTKFLNHTVEYFTACKAVDQLLDSPWAVPSKPGEEALFTTRESIVEYMDVMLRHKLFHRARKIVVPESELKSKKKKDKEKDKDSDKDAKKVVKEVKEKEKESEQSKKKKEDTVTAAESSQAEEKTDKEITGAKHKKEEGEKKKRKIRLDMHLQQLFVDGTDAYVWLYEPTPYYYYFFGFLVVIAVIAVCLFPLWPSSVRQGVYYLSLAAAGFLVFILALAVIRLVVFCIVWGITFGRHHLWLLPNLTEDVGFFASFWPLYKYEYKGDEVEVEEDEDGEGEGAENETKSDSSSEKNAEEGSDDTPLLSSETKDGTEEPRKGEDNSETESEGSQRSQTGKDFEIVDREEIEA